MENGYKPGTKGNIVAIGSPGNLFSFDLDENGGVTNLVPVEGTDETDEVAETEVEDETTEEVDETAETAPEAEAVEQPVEPEHVEN